MSPWHYTKKNSRSTQPDENGLLLCGLLWLRKQIALQSHSEYSVEVLFIPSYSHIHSTNSPSRNSDLDGKGVVNQDSYSSLSAHRGEGGWAAELECVAHEYWYTSPTLLFLCAVIRPYSQDRGPLLLAVLPQVRIYTFQLQLSSASDWKRCGSHFIFSFMWLL